MDFKPEIIQRFFDGNYSRKDYLCVKEMFSSPKKKAKLKDFLESHWLKFDNNSIEQTDTEALLQKINSRIQNEELHNNHKKRFLHWRQIAAIFIFQIMLTSIVAYFLHQQKQPQQTSYAEIQCPLGARIKFSLPDGSTGFLNSGSTLKYPVQFATNRNIDLYGEAWFDVAHDEKHPFFVNTNNLDVEVLGTHFNVISYPKENTEEIILENGSVKVLNDNLEVLSVLKPDQRLVYKIDEKIYWKEDIDVRQYLGWTKGMLVFRNESMSQVSKRLGRWYNIDIEIKDKELLDYSFRATFIDEPLEEVLKILAKTTPIKYRITKRKQNSQHIYAKKKVDLYFDKKRENAF